MSGDGWGWDRIWIFRNFYDMTTRRIHDILPIVLTLLRFATKFFLFVFCGCSAWRHRSQSHKVVAVVALTDVLSSRSNDIELLQCCCWLLLNLIVRGDWKLWNKKKKCKMWMKFENLRYDRWMKSHERTKKKKHPHWGFNFMTFFHFVICHIWVSSSTHLPFHEFIIWLLPVGRGRKSEIVEI